MSRRSARKASPRSRCETVGAASATTPLIGDCNPQSRTRSGATSFRSRKSRRRYETARELFSTDVDGDRLLHLVFQRHEELPSQPWHVEAVRRDAVLAGADASDDLDNGRGARY